MIYSLFLSDKANLNFYRSPYKSSIDLTNSPF